MKNIKRHGETKSGWRLIVSGCIVIIILVVVLLAAVYGNGGTNPLADAIQHAQSALVELFVMAMAASLAIVREVEH